MRRGGLGRRVQRVVKNNQDPVWGETHYVLVQEPDTQSLNLEVFDWDLFNVKVSSRPPGGAVIRSWCIPWCEQLV